MGDDRNDDITVRPIRLDDLEAFRDLRVEAVRDCPLGFTADLGEVSTRSPESWRDQVARNAAGGADVIVVADAGGGQLAGMSGLYVPPQGKLAHVGTVWGVYVRPLYRGQRLGERLVAACVEWARAKSLMTVKLSVIEGNEAAKRCYGRCGFTSYGVEPVAVQWEGTFHNEILMALRLR